MTTASNESAIRYSRQFSQIRQMVEAQAGLNAQAYSTKWLEMGSKPDEDPETWDYPLAAGMEIAEFINSWSYAWWTTKTWPITEPADRSNCMTELVDAWHFLVSQALIEEDGDQYRAANALLEGFAMVADAGVQSSHRFVVNEAKKLMSHLVNWTGSSMFTVEIYAQFFTVLSAAGFSLDHFHTRYSAKLQLNIFRQLNGYKDKPRTYQKNWEAGQEDNYFLAQWIDGVFADVQSGKESKLPTDAEVMKWIASSYSYYTRAKAVTPNLVEDEAE